jgi:hypothetical protein
MMISISATLLSRVVLAVAKQAPAKQTTTARRDLFFPLKLDLFFHWFSFD